MHKVVSVNIIKPMLFTAKKNLEIIKKKELKDLSANKKKSLFAMKGLMSLPDDKMIEYKYIFHQQLIDNLEMMCKVNGDILLDASEYQTLDFLYNYKLPD